MMHRLYIVCFVEVSSFLGRADALKLCEPSDLVEIGVPPAVAASIVTEMRRITAVNDRQGVPHQVIYPRVFILEVFFCYTGIRLAHDVNRFGDIYMLCAGHRR